MKEQTKSGPDRRKLRIFLIFLVCSFLAWLVSRLSEDYTDRTTFDIVYTNFPDSLVLTDASKNRIDVLLRASGFQFLGFNFVKKKVAIDLSEMDQNNTTYHVLPNTYRQQIENQLPGSMSLLEMDMDTLSFNFYKVYKKEIPVEPNVNITLGQNYLLNGKLRVKPTTITIKGPKEEIASWDKATTLKMEISDVRGNFEERVVLAKPEDLKRTSFSPNSVLVYGEVFRFSEKIMEIPVEVINLPKGSEIRTFPATIPVLCKARVGQLKKLQVSDFRVVADYRSVRGNSSNLEVDLTKSPKEMGQVQLLEREVEFILKRE